LELIVFGNIFGVILIYKKFISFDVSVNTLCNN